jgi:hypothetical protein
VGGLYRNLKVALDPVPHTRVRERNLSPQKNNPHSFALSASSVPCRVLAIQHRHEREYHAAQQGVQGAYAATAVIFALYAILAASPRAQHDTRPGYEANFLSVDLHFPGQDHVSDR